MAIVRADLKLRCSCGLGGDCLTLIRGRNIWRPYLHRQSYVAESRRGCNPLDRLVAGSALQRQNIEMALEGSAPASRRRWKFRSCLIRL